MDSCKGLHLWFVLQTRETPVKLAAEINFVLHIPVKRYLKFNVLVSGGY